MTEERTPHRTMGRPIELVKPKGVREREAERDVNESVLGQLYHKKLIGEAECQAGGEYHKHLKKAAAGFGVPDLGRIPGQADYDADVMQCEAVLWLEKTNSNLPRAFRSVLSLALHPHSEGTLESIDRHMGYPKNMMHGRMMLVEALRELAEVLGYSSEEGKRRA